MDKNYAYITLLTNDDFLTGVKLLKHSLNEVCSEYPLICMVTDAVSEKSTLQLEKHGITVTHVSRIEMPEELARHNSLINSAQADVWKDTFTKYHMFHFMEYDKLIFVDADIYIMKNTDHLFECPHMTAALDGEGFNIWPVWPHFNSGFMVIEPNEDLFVSLIDYVNTLDVSKCDGLVADQEVLNKYYSDWPLYDELHLDKYHNLFAPYFTDDYTGVDDATKRDLLDNAVFYHFIGKKPWQNTNRHCWNIKEFQFLVPIVDRMLAEENDSTKVCVYTICKNEEQHVERWYETVKTADAVCVIDTGSTDDTWNKLLACGDNMYIDTYSYEGDFNFADARNFSLDKARYVCKHIDETATWVFVTLDFDEFVEPGAIEKIKSSWDNNYDTMTLHCMEQGVDVVKDHKIHSSADWKWHRRVHELIKLDNKKRKEWNIGESNIQCEHEQDLTKHRDYYNLLKIDYSDNPKDVVLLMALTWEAMDHNEWENVLDYSETAIDVIVNDVTNELYLDYPSLTQCYLNCAAYWRHLEDYENELLGLDAAISIIENGDLVQLRKPYILRALARINVGDVDGAVDDYYHALTINTPPQCWVEETVYYDDSVLYYHIAEAYCMNSDLRQASRYIKNAIKLRPDVNEYLELQKWITKYVKD